jgi:hypothetical protein
VAGAADGEAVALLLDQHRLAGAEAAGKAQGDGPAAPEGPGLVNAHRRFFQG